MLHSDAGERAARRPALSPAACKDRHGAADVLQRRWHPPPDSDATSLPLDILNGMTARPRRTSSSRAPCLAAVRRPVPPECRAGAPHAQACARQADAALAATVARRRPAPDRPAVRRLPHRGGNHAGSAERHPGLRAFQGDHRRIENGAIGVHRVETETPSPFSAGLLFDFIAVYMYEWDQPKADR